MNFVGAFLLSSIQYVNIFYIQLYKILTLTFAAFVVYYDCVYFKNMARCLIFNLLY